MIRLRTISGGRALLALPASLAIGNGIAFALAAGAGALAIRFDAFERFAAFSRTFETAEIDDIALAVPGFLLALAVALFRRERKLRLALAGSEKRERTAYLAAREDALTGLANRRAFTEALRRACASDAPVWLLVIDLDGFKSLNDRRGHMAGDAALRHFGKRLRHLAECFGASCAGRIGGDEFGVIIDRDATPLADRIGEEFARPFLCDGRSTRLSASIGLARRCSGPGGGGEMLRAADAAMYRAKRSGGARWCADAPSACAEPPRAALADQA